MLRKSTVIDKKKGNTSKLRVKQKLHSKKKVNCVLWNWEGLVNLEMFERNTTVDRTFTESNCIK